MNKGTMRGIAPKAEVVTPTQIPNNAARLIVFGHSYAAPYLGPFGFSGSTFDEASGGLDGARFPALFANLIGIDQSRRFISLTYPAGAANGASVNFYTYVPEEGILEAIYYIPNTAMTGANTNTRAHKLFIQQDAASKEVFSYVYIAGTALAGGQTLRMLDISNAYTNSLEGYRITSGAASAFSTNTCAANANGPWSSIVGVGWNVAFIWQSTLVGTGGGLADPGGTIILRWGGTYRNLAVGGSKLCRSGIYHGGWAASFHYRPVRHTYGPEVVCATTAATSATTITVDALEYPIPSGWKVAFNNGVTATLTANALVNAASLTVSALSGQVPAGSIGTARTVTTYGYQSLTPFGFHLLTWGRNDGIITTPDRVAWRETYRAVIANVSCPYFQCSNSSNIQAVAGNGASASWTTGNAAIPAGQFITAFKNTATTIKRFTGAVGGTPPTLTIQTPPAFEGGTIDLFFAAQSGTSKGGAATITVDGGNPPTGACTINTSGVCTTENQITGLTGTLNGTTTLTFTAGTLSSGLVPELGMAVSGTGGAGTIAKGSKISAIASTTVCTVDTAGTANAGGGIAVTLSGYIPMVKRITGLTAGTHTILITLTAMDATDQSAEFIFLGYGIEAKTPATTPVLVSGIARAPADTADWDDMLNFNIDTQNVINGTAPAPSGNSVEPAFPDSVVYCDTDSVLQGNISNTLFGPDGVHPNADGHNALARAYYQKTAESFSADELLAR